jgi:hypothetical protein
MDSVGSATDFWRLRSQLIFPSRFSFQAKVLSISRPFERFRGIEVTGSGTTIRECAMESLVSFGEEASGFNSRGVSSLDCS